MATNTFTGTIPDLSDLVNLKTLHLYENDFTGTLPESLQQLKSIESLFLSSNRFTGTIPESLSLMSRTLTGLYLSDNYFEGTIPTHLCEFIGLEALFLDTNKLSGSIPACFGGFSDLKQLYLFNNQLTGKVPSSIQGLKQLSKFWSQSTKVNQECNCIRLSLSYLPPSHPVPLRYTFSSSLTFPTTQPALVSNRTILLVKYPTRCADLSTTKTLICGPTVPLVRMPSSAPAAVFAALENHAFDHFRIYY